MEPEQVPQQPTPLNEAQTYTYNINTMDHMYRFSLPYGVIALLWSMISLWVLLAETSGGIFEMSQMQQIGAPLLATSTAMGMYSTFNFFGVCFESPSNTNYGRKRWLLGEACRSFRVCAFCGELGVFFMGVHWVYGEMYRDYRLEITGYGSLLMFKNWYIQGHTVFPMLDQQLEALDYARLRNE